MHQADEAFSTVAEAVEAAEAEVEEKISEELQEESWMALSNGSALQKATRRDVCFRSERVIGRWWG